MHARLHPRTPTYETDPSDLWSTKQTSSTDGPSPWSCRMTDSERIAALESRVAAYDAFFKFGVNPHDGSTYVMTMGCFGVMTEFWSKQPLGEGAALSVGTDVDRYGIYVEVEASAPVKADRTAILARCDAINPHHINRAVQTIANNAQGNVGLSIEAQGIEVAPSIASIVIGKIGSTLKQ